MTDVSHRVFQCSEVPAAASNLLKGAVELSCEPLRGSRDHLRVKSCRPGRNTASVAPGGFGFGETIKVIKGCRDTGAQRETVFLQAIGGRKASIRSLFCPTFANLSHCFTHGFLSRLMANAQRLSETWEATVEMNRNDENDYHDWLVELTETISKFDLKGV